MQEKMHEKIKKLAELQSIDSKLEAIEKSRGNLPFLVVELEKEINEKTEEIGQIGSEKDTLEIEIKNSKALVESSKIMLEKYKHQRNMVTNNKEYEALIKEIDFRENTVVEEEEKIVDLNEKLIRNNEALEVLKRSVEEKKSMLEEKRSQLEMKLAETQEEEKLLKEKRIILVAKIDKHLYNLYRRIYDSKGQVAVVPANEGHCGGCFTILPSQKLSELKRAESIVQCDACSRILFYEIKDAD